MKIMKILWLVALLLSGLSCAWAQTARTNAASEADKAWKEVEKAAVSPMPPAEWQGRPTEAQVAAFRAQQNVIAANAADKANAFYTHYPDHPKAAEARKKELEMLQLAVHLGNTNKIATLDQRVQERLKDPNVKEEERLELRADAVQRAIMGKSSAGEKAMLAEQEKGGRELIKEFPKQEVGYGMLLEVAENSDAEKGRALAKEVIDAKPPEELETAAKGLLKKLDALGKPLSIRFAAIDGREVDLTKLTNKVVLIDFWATWCRPCVAEVPHVKKTYEQLHAKGFEIVGISFDQEKEELKKFVADNKMPWPQFFDGKGWENKFGQEYAIHSIPTMWLVDKKGNLRDMNAGSSLEEKVQKFLAE